MTRLLLKNFVRAKGLMLGLLLLFIAGCISLYIGHRFIEQNKETVEQSAHFQQENMERYVEYNQSSIGTLLYYLRFGLVYQAPHLVGLAIGQRDINPSVISVNIRNLEEQKYTSALMNPMYQLLGNMDFSFVLLYFFPLIIIAFCYNLVSEEKEEGIWDMILSQTAQPLQMLSIKLGIRFASVMGVLLLLLTLAGLGLNIPLDKAFVSFCLVAIVYVVFWFCLTCLVISFHLSSSQNALVLLLSWISLTLILPASVHALSTYLYPIPEAYGTVLESRDGYHTQWDKPKEPTIAQFHAQYPQFSSYNHPSDQEFSWLWYFAMQQMGDQHAANDAKVLAEKLRARGAFSQAMGWVIPTIHTQLSLNSLSQSDLLHHLHFLEALEDFHEDKRLYFYPKIFEDAAVAEEDWSDFGLAFHQKPLEISGAQTVLPPLLASFLLLFLARMNWRMKMFIEKN